MTIAKDKTVFSDIFEIKENFLNFTQDIFLENQNFFTKCITDTHRQHLILQRIGFIKLIPNKKDLR